MLQSLYYVNHILVPILFIVIITHIIFWLPPSCGERLSLGITLLLAFSVFQIIIADNTPINSDSTPMISKYQQTINTLYKEIRGNHPLFYF